MKNIIHKVRRVEVRDFIHIFLFLIALLPGLIMKLFHRDLWLLCEDKMEARDNGYWLFKYITEEHPEQDCVYAINRKSVDYEKVAKLGRTVKYGSLLHWIYYIGANWNVSSQKGGKPNAALCYFFEVYGIIKNKSVFLQHGVIMNDLKWLYYEVTKMSLFCCGAYPEYQFVRDTFHYPPGIVQYLGLCRFDNLHKKRFNEKMIVIMPTWREWIADEDYRLKKCEGTKDVVDTVYFKAWNTFLKNQRLIKMAKEKNIKILFYPHREMQKYISLFSSVAKEIEIADRNRYNLQELLLRTSLLITDYSSVAFDVIYQRKPVLYYQFDYEMFRKNQYGEGYFDYKNNPFGKSFEREENLVEEMEKIVENNFEVSEKFLQAHKEFFPIYDTDNCKRTYYAIKKMG